MKRKSEVKGLLGELRTVGISATSRFAVAAVRDLRKRLSDEEKAMRAFNRLRRKARKAKESSDGKGG